MALRLTIPASVSTPNPPAETRPKQLKDWLSGLPLTRLFESTRAVCDELARLNRLRIAADERLKLLEIYNPVLQHLRAEIAEDYDKASLPLPATSRQAVNLARELLIEEAYAYKLALLEKTNKLMLFGTRKQLVPLIEQLMRTLSNSLTLSYQSYLPTPAGVWQEMHELYRYASQQKLIGEEVEKEGEAIEIVYKSAVLIALADPYRLPRPALHDVMRVTAQVAPTLEVHLNQSPPVTPIFVILPDTDKPPKLASQSGVESEQRSTAWAIDANALLRRISEVVSERESGTQRGSRTDVLYAAPLEQLQRLIQCWGMPHKRSFPRQAVGQATVHICAGVGRVCKLFGNAPAMNADQRHQNVLSATANSISEWDVINQSAAGIKLRGMPLADTAISVGEIIAVQYRGMAPWSVGAVRWAQMFDDGSVELGIQMLAPRAEAATLEPTIGSHSPQRVLLLPPLSTLHQPAAIVAQPGSFMPGREFVLTQPTQIVTIRASELVEKTASYDLFRFMSA